MARFSKFTKFIKRNKVIAVLIAVFLLSVILVPSLYFGLKKTPTPTSSPSEQDITFSDQLIGKQGAIIDLSKYTIKKINITITGIHFDNSIEASDINRNILELVKLLTGDSTGEENNKTNYLSFSEIMNTKDRGLMVKSYSDKYGIKSYHEIYPHKQYNDPVYPNYENVNIIELILEQVDYYTIKCTYKISNILNDIISEQDIVLNKVFSLENLKYLVINFNPADYNPAYYDFTNELIRTNNLTYTVNFTNYN
jgi:hypothetical protein